MKSATLTFEASRRTAPAKRREGGIVFAWSVIGFTSTLIMVGFAFFTYAFTHLP